MSVLFVGGAVHGQLLRCESLGVVRSSRGIEAVIGMQLLIWTTLEGNSERNTV
jgi:hypothetical protein